MNQIEEQVMHIQRDINCLLDEDRNTRRAGLNKLNDFFKSADFTKLIILEKYVLKNLLRVFEDKIEKNREIALAILQSYLSKQEQYNTEIMEVILKALIARLYQIPYPESSEELRLTTIKLITQILNKSPQSFMSVLPEYSNMLFKALSDQFPEMKRVLTSINFQFSSLLCIDSAQQLTKYIGGYMLNVVKQIAQNMSHQHSKVRSVSVQALAPIILCEGSGSFLEFALTGLKTLTQDKATEVRKATFLSLSQILCHFSVANLNQFENQLYLLLMNGLSDENKEIQILTLQYLDEVGQKRKQLDEEMGLL